MGNTNELVELMFTAKRPWNADGEIPHMENTHRKISKPDADSQAQIDKCLTCELLVCTNCVEDGRRRTEYALQKVLKGQESLFEEERMMM